MQQSSSSSKKAAVPPYNGAPYHDLVRWCDAYDQKLIDKDELLGRLQKREQFYQERRQGALNVEAGDDVKAMFQEELRVGLMGIDSLINAVRELQQWLESGEYYLRNQGLARAESACHMMHKAMTLNCESMHTIMESAEEFINSQTGAGDSASFNGDLGLIGGMNITGF